MRKLIMFILLSSAMLVMVGCEKEDNPPIPECAGDEYYDGSECQKLDCLEGWTAINGQCVEEEYVYGGSSVLISGHRVYVDNQPFFIQGVCWNPTNRGSSTADYDGNVEVDAVLMKEAGINVVRTYGPITDIGVLDTLYENGIYVINSVYNSSSASPNSVIGIINAVKDHPAILMWSIGNEWNYNGLYSDMTTEEAMERLNEVAAIIQDTDPYHPVATIYGHVPPTNIINQMPDIDIWGINVYSGLNIGYVFDQWELQSTKPLFIAEYGADAWNANTNSLDLDAQAHATTVLTQEIINNNAHLNDINVSIGSTIFEFTDEWWKAGNPLVQDTGGSAPGAGPYPDNTFNEEYWGLLDLDRNPRPAYYALQELYLNDEEE